MSCRKIFKDYDVLTLSSLYILEVTCFIKEYKKFMETKILMSIIITCEGN
jgi:hypothetical protein